MSSRKEEKEQRRAERIAHEQDEQEQARRKRIYAIVVGGVLAVAAIAAVAVAVTAGGDGGSGSHSGGVPGAGDQTYEGGVDPPPQQATELAPAAQAAGCRLSNPVIEGRTHVEESKDIEYKTNPPTSGNHDPQPADDGVYDRAFNARDTKHFVHTLEHGRIEIQYDPSLPKREVDRLGGLFNEDPYHVLLMPNRRMPYQVAATAWGHLIGCDKLTDETFDALRAFRDRYRDQGPEQSP